MLHAINASCNKCFVFFAALGLILFIANCNNTEQADECESANEEGVGHLELDQEVDIGDQNHSRRLVCRR